MQKYELLKNIFTYDVHILCIHICICEYVYVYILTYKTGASQTMCLIIMDVCMYMCMYSYMYICMYPYMCIHVSIDI